MEPEQSTVPGDRLLESGAAAPQCLPEMAQSIFEQFPIDELLHQYTRDIAGQMHGWIASDRSYYSRKVLPLASSRPVLRLAFAAVAARRAEIDFGMTDFPDSARDMVVSAITDCVNSITSHPEATLELSKELDLETAQWMLASMLALCNYEMSHSGATAAEYHRKALRALTNVLWTTEWCHDELLVYLRNRVSVYDVFRCTTLFDLNDIEGAILPETHEDNDEDGMYSAFISLIHRVTILSRQLGMPAQSSNNPDYESNPSFSDLRGDFEQARAETLMAAGRLDYGLSQVRIRDFVRMVDMHHNAGILYSIRCLSFQEPLRREVAVSDLFDQIHSIEDLDPCYLDLAWPVFIAGTESYGDAERQATVSSLYEAMSNATKLKQYAEVMAFQKTFWAGSRPDWRELAREWEITKRHVLLY